MSRRYITGHRERGEGRRILVGLPLTEYLLTEFFVGYDRLEIPSSRTVKVSGAYVQDAHNEIAHKALERRDWETLLLMEQDHTFPDNLLERVASYDGPITGAMYCLRKDPHPVCALVPKPEHESAAHWRGEDWQGHLTYLWPSLAIEWSNQGRLFPVCAVGMGCTAIQRRVLERFAELGELPFQVPYQEGGQLITDDVYFCRRARQLGFDVWLDAGLQLDHLGVQHIGLPQHLAGLERRAREQGLL